MTFFRGPNIYWMYMYAHLNLTLERNETNRRAQQMDPPDFNSKISFILPSSQRTRFQSLLGFHSQSASF